MARREREDMRKTDNKVSLLIPGKAKDAIRGVVRVKGWRGIESQKAFNQELDIILRTTGQQKNYNLEKADNKFLL